MKFSGNHRRLTGLGCYGNPFILKELWGCAFYTIGSDDNDPDIFVGAIRTAFTAKEISYVLSPVAHFYEKAEQGSYIKSRKLVSSGFRLLRSRRSYSLGFERGKSSLFRNPFV